jgi:hypothetical protein
MAPQDYHMLLSANRIRLSQGPKIHHTRPPADRPAGLRSMVAAFSFVPVSSRYCHIQVLWRLHKGGVGRLAKPMLSLRQVVAGSREEASRRINRRKDVIS